MRYFAVILLFAACPILLSSTDGNVLWQTGNAESIAPLEQWRRVVIAEVVLPFQTPPFDFLSNLTWRRGFEPVKLGRRPNVRPQELVTQSL